ncbi:hypothetical protein RJ639_040247 [Escallonia herrerae]|uniref:S-acyltransferase n=1 Tax=Escallonia herrerae TaxID=1293975 RepID=A0AA88WLB3_9ASTE|nr:hypothetical protein RJ639_040247 [Escallonia herrerae]
MHMVDRLVGISPEFELVFEDQSIYNNFLCLYLQKFYFKGRVMSGPDARSLIVTILLILVPVVIFCTFVARNLLHKFPAYNAGYAILVVAVFFTIYVLGLLLLTATRDPGIIPRNSHPPEEEMGYESPASVEASGRSASGQQFPRTKEVFVNGQPVRVKYCETCMLYRPPRCSHCSVCNNCVEKFDHHCPWVGQCIGKRNYCCFFLFVSSSAVLCIFVFSISALDIKFLANDYGSVWKAIKESPASMVLMAYSFVLLWFVGGLTGFHLYLIGTNRVSFLFLLSQILHCSISRELDSLLLRSLQFHHRQTIVLTTIFPATITVGTLSTTRQSSFEKHTTYENFRYRVDSRLRIYDRGCLTNFNDVFCVKAEPSRNNFRAYAHEEASKPPKISLQETEADEYGEDRRVKVEDELDIGDDLLKISQRHEFEEGGDIRNRGSYRVAT